MRLKTFFLITTIVQGVLNPVFALQQDLVWTPEPYEYRPGESVKYIDYENGDDKNAGTKDSPWKHHPWDKEAGKKAASCKGIHTYVFKKGVSYRGSLYAKESGTPDNPIKLTVDPSWGTGEAMFYGSVKAPQKWKKLTNANELPFPASSAGKIWFVDMKTDIAPKLAWEVRDGSILPIVISREPDWKVITPEDPKADWWSWNGHNYTGFLPLESIEGFKVGDKLWITPGGKAQKIRGANEALKIGNSRESSRLTVIGITNNRLQVESRGYCNYYLKNQFITNGVAKSKATGNIVNLKHRFVDTNNLKGKPKDYYEGAFIQAEQYSYAGYGHPSEVASYDPVEGSITMTKVVSRIAQRLRLPNVDCRYYFENKPQFLDQAGEFYYHTDNQRLYIWLSEDRDPNTAHIEIAKHQDLIKIENQNNIEISGLAIRFGNIKDWLAKNVEASAISLRGNCSGIKVSHCTFEHQIKALLYYPINDGDLGDLIEISDCQIKHTEQNAIAISYGTGWVWGSDSAFPNNEPLGKINRIKVLRNNIYDIGHHPSRGDACHALLVKGGGLVEVAHNVIKRTYGAGIEVINNRFTTINAKQAKYTSYLNRILVHHNKVENTLLESHDWGSISSWGVGPAYLYNNITGNPVGYKHFTSAKGPLKNRDKLKGGARLFGVYAKHNFGVGIYLDHCYKGFVFNNIAWGKSNNLDDKFYNFTATFESIGFINHIFQNTFYNYTVGTSKGGEAGSRGRYHGNLYLDIGETFYAYSSADFDNTISFSHNVYQKGINNDFAHGKGQMTYKTIDEWNARLQEQKSLSSDCGEVVSGELVRNAKELDFTLIGHESTIDKGVKMFVPWGLYKTVGEWQFYKNYDKPGLATGEHLVCDEEWLRTPMFKHIPRHDLEGVNFELNDYEAGILEDWTEGALNLNGLNQYLFLDDAMTRKPTRVNGGAGGRRQSYPGEQRLTTDFDQDNMLIELVVKTKDRQTGGVLVSKGSNENGYHLLIDGAGKPTLQVSVSGSQFSVNSSLIINDDEWHHFIVEVDRKNKTAAMYIDSEKVPIKVSGTIHNKALRNSSDFTVGRHSTNENGYFKGSIDYLRISRGTLEDAMTTIDELYTWQFDGPFLKDMNGMRYTGKSRDIGALEFLDKEREVR